jgi:hypothetical protein
VGDTQTDTNTHTQTDRQAGDLISPLSFFESRLKMQTIPKDCCARLKIMPPTNKFEPQQF